MFRLPDEQAVEEERERRERLERTAKGLLDGRKLKRADRTRDVQMVLKLGWLLLADDRLLANNSLNPIGGGPPVPRGSFDTFSTTTFTIKIRKKTAPIHAQSMILSRATARPPNGPLLFWSPRSLAPARCSGLRPITRLGLTLCG
jgi:hypothetical protein